MSTYPQLTAPTAPPYPSLADLLAELPTAERRRFKRELRFAVETVNLASTLVREPRPGLDSAQQFADLLAFSLWQLKLLRRSIVRTGFECVIGSAS